VTYKPQTATKATIESLTCNGITLAAWIRYLMGIDDNGNEMNISPDPMLKELQAFISKIEFKNIESVENNLYPILSNKNIFLVDLYDYNINLGKRIENYFKEMIKGVVAIKNDRDLFELGNKGRDNGDMEEYRQKFRRELSGILNVIDVLGMNTDLFH